MKKPIDLNEALKSDRAERVSDRLAGDLTEQEEKVWSGDYVASGGGKSPEPNGPTPIPPAEPAS